MFADLTSGILVVSIDVDSVAAQRPVGQVHSSTQLFSRLAELLGRYRFPATWAVSDPAGSAITPILLKSPVRHEIAVLADSTWVGRRAGRTQFARQLTRHVHRARTAGFPVSTLALQNAEMTENYDLLVKHQISMIRPSRTTSRNVKASGTLEAIRYGVWQLPTQLDLPGPSRWLTSVGRRKLLRAIERSVANRCIVHVTIQGSAISESPRRGIRMVEQLLADTLPIRRERQLAVATLRQVATHLAKPRKHVSARSILRKAA